MIALDLYPAVLHGTAGAALLLQLLAEPGQLRGRQRQAGDHGNPAALAPLGLEFQPNLALPDGSRRVVATALALGSVAPGAHAAVVRRVDESIRHGGSARIGESSRLRHP